MGEGNLQIIKCKRPTDTWEYAQENANQALEIFPDFSENDYHTKNLK